MNKLKCRIQGFGKIKCKRTNKKIDIKQCANCPYKDYQTKKQKPLVAKTKLKQRTSKQAKLERDRFSIFPNDLKRCYYHKDRKANPHEIFCGKNRKNSMIYGMCISLCEECHSMYQNDAEFNKYWHKQGQLPI